MTWGGTWMATWKSSAVAGLRLSGWRWGGWIATGGRAWPRLRGWESFPGPVDWQAGYQAALDKSRVTHSDIGWRLAGHRDGASPPGAPLGRGEA